jgi:penicillin amidase
VRKRLLLIGLVLVALATGGAWWWGRASLPLLDGEVPLPGLRAPVEVLFDAAGVPHVYALDHDDAWFAAGVMHARDRLWQMELYRRVTLGRLSEVLGEAALPIDKRMLSVDLRGRAEADLERVGSAAKAALDRYAEGVNAHIASLTTFRQRPLEMQVLGIVPAPWAPVDSLAVARLMAWRLSENHQSELVRAALAARVGPEAAQALAGRYAVDAPDMVDGPPATAQPTSPPTSPAGPAAESTQKARESLSRASEWPHALRWLHPAARRGNSNAWVVAPSRSETARPILANDPHLQIEFPSAWYEMHLVGAGLDVIGVTLPGLPFVAIGHNGRIAWGFTNSGADVQDLYLERLDLTRRQYQNAGGWQPAQVTRVEIPVRGRARPEPFDIWRTLRGPIYAEPGEDWEEPPAWMSPDAPQPESTESRRSVVTAYALRWEVEGDVAGSFDALNRASDWASFLAAVEGFAFPSQNVVYADVDGNIGYALAGQLPIRLAGDGTMPSDGAAGGGAWSGTVGSSRLPRVLNPGAGYVVSANNEVDRGFTPPITRDWAAPYRATRLRDVLSQGRGLSLDAIATLQSDRRSLAAERVLAGLPQALAAAKARSAEPLVVEALARLSQWDRVVDARPVVTLYQAFEDAVWRRTFADELGEPLFRAFYDWAGADRPAGLHAIVDDRQSRWFDDNGTVDARETRDDIFVLAAGDAARRLPAEFGGESSQGWDDVHAARFSHALGASMALGWLFNGGRVPITGDAHTVMRVSWERSRPFEAFELPTWRQILDVGDWDQSRVVLTTGQSGHRLSAHWFDQSELWAGGGHRRQPFTRGAVEAVREHRLLLTPQ